MFHLNEKKCNTIRARTPKAGPWVTQITDRLSSSSHIYLSRQRSSPPLCPTGDIINDAHWVRRGLDKLETLNESLFSEAPYHFAISSWKDGNYVRNYKVHMMCHTFNLIVKQYPQLGSHGTLPLGIGRDDGPWMTIFPQVLTSWSMNEVGNYDNVSSANQTSCSVSSIVHIILDRHQKCWSRLRIQFLFTRSGNHSLARKNTQVRWITFATYVNEILESHLG